MGDGLCLGCRGIERQKADWLGASGITTRHRPLTLLSELSGPSEYLATKKAVGDFLRSDARSVLALIGDRGTGKTQLMCAYVHALIMQGRQSVIISAVRLLSDLKARYEIDQGSADSGWLDDWRLPWLLVIDEYREHLASDWARVMLATLIDERYAAMHPTVLLANVADPAEFSGMVGSSIADRCNDGGGVIVCDWPSFRQGVKP